MCLYRRPVIITYICSKHSIFPKITTIFEKPAYCDIWLIVIIDKWSGRWCRLSSAQDKLLCESSLKLTWMPEKSCRSTLPSLAQPLIELILLEWGYFTANIEPFIIHSFIHAGVTGLFVISRQITVECGQVQNDVQGAVTLYFTKSNAFI